MRIRRRLLITYALFAAVLAFMTLRSAPSYAVGDIHLIVVRSTADPALNKVETINDVLNPRILQPGIIGVFEPPLNFPHPIEGVATHRVLEGQDADPRNIADVCREVSQKAGPDDAIMVLAQCRAAIIPTSSGAGRCVLFPMATSEDPNDRGVGLPRGTILKNLNVKPHRLIALITETYEGPTRREEVKPSPFLFEKPKKLQVIPRPKNTPYLIKFLQTARGELNIGNHTFPLELAGSPGFSDGLEGVTTPSVFAASLVLSNGLYLESELNPDDFYKHLTILDACLAARTPEKEKSPDAESESGHPWGFVRYDGSQIVPSEPAVHFATPEENFKFCAARRAELVDSGEFEVMEINLRSTSDESNNSNDDDDSDFVPAPGEQTPLPTSDDDADFVPAPNAQTPRQTLDDGDDTNNRSTWSESSSREAGTRQTLEIGNAEYGFCWIPAGEFDMGSPESEEGRDDDETLHHVTLTKGFWMLETEATQALYREIMGENPSYGFKEDNLPVNWVSWDSVTKFCEELTKRLPKGVTASLPTEAQWEYACRAGTTTPFSFGSVLNGDKANCDGSRPYGASTEGKSLGKSTPVMSYSPNAWGLYDMHGNVNEWVLDWHGDYPTGTAVDPAGPNGGSYRVARGGAWGFNAGGCRSASRDLMEPRNAAVYLGFRFLLSCD